MKSELIRETFFNFFEEKGHKIVPSAPIVNPSDPSLMFTNAGMNQFKDFFLGNQEATYARIADTQKCLRVSGKHNDLEEVGKDSYHHTMFEMLGNWSFGDYFKEEAIDWAWELLTEVYGIEKDRIYATIYEGAAEDSIPIDKEAQQIWSKYLPSERILAFAKKDNFWEMGDTGPCGPCSEIHIDIRSEEDRQKVDGVTLVNQDHPQVIEIWNLVFIQYQRMQDGSLEPLPQRHVDTGMGFERLCMIMQSKQSNYETDLFAPYFSYLQEKVGKRYQAKYGENYLVDTAFRVVVDHLRAVVFAIADGALPSNTGAGYVIRRILRRAIRYYYSFLDQNEPLMYEMVGIMANQFANVFPEVAAQKDFIQSVILEEENSFLRTLDEGLKRIDTLNLKEGDILAGEVAFELYDTYGFPIDLTVLITSEKGVGVDTEGFEEALAEQKRRSRAVAEQEIGDWTVLLDQKGTEFLGYDTLVVEGVRVIKYRELRSKKGTQYQVVLDKTPFYAEGGGQVGDTGLLMCDNEAIRVLDTQRENELVVHFVEAIPQHIDKPCRAEVDAERRLLIENNHSATHLLHAALRQVLGTHVQQKGSLVAPTHLRFDFSHFQRMTKEEIREVERIVNQKIRENVERQEDRTIAIDDAKRAGAMMLFGEKYGEKVRMITFGQDYSIELCGGCHVPQTGRIGFFKITNETSVASGVRRIEAVTAHSAESYIQEQLDTLGVIGEHLKHPKDLIHAIQNLQDDNKALRKEIELLKSQKASAVKDELIEKAVTLPNCNAIVSEVNIQDVKILKDITHQLLASVENAVIILGAEVNNKAHLMIAIDKTLTESMGLHAGNIVRELARYIKGGGGGQAFFASAGGADPSGLAEALSEARRILKI